MHFNYNDDNLTLCIEYKKNSSKNYSKIVSLLKKIGNYIIDENVIKIKLDKTIDIVNNIDKIQRVIKLAKKSKSLIFIFSNNDISLDEIKKVLFELKNSDKYRNYEHLLPLPYVNYGNVFSFASVHDGSRFYCECMKDTVNNIRALKGDVIPILEFKKNICHKCNKIKPEKQYLHPMYGTIFIQYYGWYIKQNFYKLGIDYDEYSNYLSDVVPSDLMEHLEFYKDKNNLINQYQIDLNKCIEKFSICEKNIIDYVDKNYTNIDVSGPYSWLMKDKIIYSYCTGELSADPDCPDMKLIKELYEKKNELSNIINKLISDRDRNEIYRYVENYTRKEFDYPLVHEKWASETELYNIVSKLYPNKEIKKHYRPEWMEGLELDIFIPSMNLAFEYQGIQHYEPIKHWGGEEKLIIQQEHDVRKVNICNKLGIKLIIIKYTEELNIKNIENIIQENL